MTLADQIAVYDGMRDELEAEHSGEWVVVHDGVVAGFHGSFQTAAADAHRRDRSLTPTLESFLTRNLISTIDAGTAVAARINDSIDGGDWRYRRETPIRGACTPSPPCERARAASPACRWPSWRATTP